MSAVNTRTMLLRLAFLGALVSCARQAGSPSPIAGLSTAAPSLTPDPTLRQTLPPSLQTLDLITPPSPEITFVRQVLPSPDGQWLAQASFEFLDSGAAFRVRLAVRKSDGSVEWTPVDYTQRGLGYNYPALRSWSPDSRFFYYFNMPIPDGCGDFYPIESEWSVLDVTTGALSALSVPVGRGHTISPDARTMVYASASPPYNLHFHSTVDFSEQLIPLPLGATEGEAIQAGGAVWSPDGSSFVLSVAYGDPCGEEPLSFSIVRVDDVSGPVLYTLIDGSRKLLRVLLWDPSNRILVRDWNDYSWWIDSLTGQTVPAPAPEAQQEGSA